MFTGVMAMASLLHIFFIIFLLGLTGSSGQESSSSSNEEALNLHNKILQLPKFDDLDFAISVSDDKTLTEISSSVVKAETWLRTHVLSLYPSTKITTIVTFLPDFCKTNQQENDIGHIVLSSLKNIYHSLTRWGLQKDIKVSPGFSYQCLLEPKNPKNDVFEADEVIKSIFVFLQTVNSTFTINPPPNFLLSSDNHPGLLRFMKKFRSLSFNKVNFINPNPEKDRTIMIRRKLRSLMDFSNKVRDSYPARPTPLPEISPIHAFIGFSAPATIARYPFPPNPRPSLSPAAAFSPELPPEAHDPPFSSLGSPTLPPCAPPYAATPPTRFAATVPAPAKSVEGLWCVAKPSVPEETLQQALDFACGEGGADCDEISPHGNCFYPDTAVAHASYAFNSYWQKTKKNGGICSFGGTAMLITTDPSFHHCRFVLS